MEPVTAARPRVSKWGTYYPPKYTKWKQAATEILTKSKAALAPMTGTLALVVEQVMTKPRTSKLDIPVGDIDNHLKGPMDALTKAGKVWGDDKQVACVLAIKRFSTGENDKPGTYITVVPLYGE